jgi:outer membrane protein TolC
MLWEKGLGKALAPFIFAAMLTLMAVSISGCLHEKRYNYHAIREEYRGKVATATTLPEPETRMEAAAPVQPIAISGAIDLALKNNPDIHMAIARIRQSEAMIDEAMASFWPVLSLYAEYVQGDAPSAYLFKTIDQRKLPPGVDFNDPGWFENYEAGVQGSLNLFNGGRNLLLKRMAETGLQIQELDRQSVENALVASVIHAYYNVLAALDFIRICEESVSTVETQLKITNVQYLAGGVLRSDLLSLEVRLAQAREDLIRAESNQSLSLAALANILGLDPDAAITFSARESLSLELPADYRAGLVHALANRPELKMARLRIIQSRMGLDLARSELLPRLDARARYYFDDPSLDFEVERENWTAGIIMNWDLFTGFSTRARKDKAEGVLEEMLAADRKSTLSVQLDLRTAYLRLAEAGARVRVTEASLAQAEESLRLVSKQYEGGSATITRYLEVELARNMARIRATAALYDEVKAKAAVARALGYWSKMPQER